MYYVINIILTVTFSHPRFVLVTEFVDSSFRLSSSSLSPQVEGLIRDENLNSAFEILEFFCELLAQRVPTMERAKEPPPELVEALTTVLFASSRQQDLQELTQASNITPADAPDTCVARC